MLPEPQSDADEHEESATTVVVGVNSVVVITAGPSVGLDEDGEHEGLAVLAVGPTVG